MVVLRKFARQLACVASRRGRRSSSVPFCFSPLLQSATPARLHSLQHSLQRATRKRIKGDHHVKTPTHARFHIYSFITFSTTKPKWLSMLFCSDAASWAKPCSRCWCVCHSASALMFLPLRSPACVDPRALWPDEFAFGKTSHDVKRSRARVCSAQACGQAQAPPPQQHDALVAVLCFQHEEALLLSTTHPKRLLPLQTIHVCGGG
jgi:hypothetical protein